MKEELKEFILEVIGENPNSDPIDVFYSILEYMEELEEDLDWLKETEE